MRIASPSESGAAVVDMSYRGSCDTIETVNAPGSFNNTQTVNRARKTTGWSKPAKVIILVEGRGKRNDHDSQRECFRTGDDIATFYHYSVLAPQYTYLKHAYGPTWIRHNGSTNYSFLDGHVERLFPEDAGEIAKDYLDYY